MSSLTSREMSDLNQSGTVNEDELTSLKRETQEISFVSDELSSAEKPTMCDVDRWIFFIGVAFCLMFAMAVTGPGLAAKGTSARLALQQGKEHVHAYHWFMELASNSAREIELPVYLIQAAVCLLMPIAVDHLGSRLSLLLASVSYAGLAAMYYITYWGAMKQSRDLKPKQREQIREEMWRQYKNDSKKVKLGPLSSQYTLATWIQVMQYVVGAFKAIGSPMLWTAFGDYMTEKSTEANRGVTNGAFFAIYRLNFLVAAGFGAILKAIWKAEEDITKILLTYLFFSVVPIAVFVAMIVFDKRGEVEAGKRKTCKEALSAFTDWTTVRILLLAFAVSGMAKNYWLTLYVAELGGLEKVMNINIVVGVVCFLCSYAFGWAFDRVKNKKWLFYLCLFAALLQICLCGAAAARKDTRYESKAPTNPADPQRWPDWSFYFLGLLQLGIAGVDAMLYATYPLLLGEERAMSAFAAHQLFYAVGMACAGAFNKLIKEVDVITIQDVSWWMVSPVILLALILFWTLPSIEKPDTLEDFDSDDHQNDGDKKEEDTLDFHNRNSILTPREQGNTLETHVESTDDPTKKLL